MSNLHYENPLSLIKYLGHCDKTTKVNLSNSDIKKEVIMTLAEEIYNRSIVIEELNLSHLPAIDDDLLIEISHYMFGQNESGTSSKVTKIVLDHNNITNVGFTTMVDKAAQNTVLRSISV